MITGATTSQHELTTATIVAFSLAFLITAALWWLYFNLVAAIAERRLAEAVNRTVLARDAYTYLHVVIVAGILLTAVGDELVIAHPTDELPDGELLAVVSGPALYLLSLVLLRLRMAGTLGWRRLAGAIACLAIGAIGTFAPALVVVGTAVRRARGGDRRRPDSCGPPQAPRRALAARAECTRAVPG